MKKLITLCIALCLFSHMHAQKMEKKENNRVFTKGTKVAQIGVGLGASLGLPIGISFETGITEKIGLGAYVGYASKSYTVLTNKYRVSNIIIAARGNYHFYQTEKIDAYGGAIIGYNVAKAKWVGNITTPINNSYGGVTWGALVGARYYFNPSLAVFGELGYGLGYLTVGLAKKF